MNITVNCDLCGKSFPTWSAWAKKRKHSYCSKECKNKHHGILYGSGETKSDYQKRYYLEHREKKIAQAKERYKTRPEEKAAYDKLRRTICAQRLSAERRARYLLTKDHRQVATMMVRAAKTRAKKFGIPFEINVEDISIPEICPALGIPLMFNSGRSKDNSPSLDRIVPSLGYVRGNISVISHRANKIKHNASFEEISKVANWLRQFDLQP